MIKSLLLSLMLLVNIKLYCQCPNYISNGSFYDQYCGNSTGTTLSSYCVNFELIYYSTVEFYSSGEENIFLTVMSDMEFSMNPGTTLFAHTFILDSCEGTPVFSTISGACTVMSDYVVDINGPLTNYYVELNLPEGTYTLYYGYISTLFVQNNIVGCVDVFLTGPVFLDLELPKEEEKEISEVKKIQTYRKYYHPTIGLLIILPDGRSLDMMGRQVTTYKQ